MALNNHKGGNKQEKTVCKGAWWRLYINLKVIFVVWLVLAIFFSAKVSASTLILTNQAGQEVSQSILKSTHLAIQVRGMLAFVEVEQVYQNPSIAIVNGCYQFPLPSDSAVFYMQMRLDNRVITGVVKEKHTAQKIYQRAQQQGHKAALVKQQAGNIFQTEVANIEPGQEISVKIKFQLSLGYAAESFVLRLPTVINPRYANQLLASQKLEVETAQFKTAEVKGGLITDFLPRNVLSHSPVKHTITTNIDIDLGFELEDITSQSHAISVQQLSQTQFKIEPTDNVSLLADRDLELRFKPFLSQDVLSQVFYEKVDGEYYYKIMLLPPKHQFTQHSLPRELIFVIDTSGSMAGTSLAQAKKALILTLQSLNTDDQFNIIAFDSNINRFKPSSIAATYTGIQAAKQFITELKADGGTEINQAMAASFNGKYDSTRVRQIILITDGAISHSDSLKQLVKQHRADSKVFMVGIGSAPNGHIMKLLAKEGRGDYVFIDNLYTISEEVAHLNQKLAYPALQNIRLFNELGLPLDNALPVGDLYFSSPLVVYFKLPNKINNEDKNQNKDKTKAVQLNGDNSAGQFSNRISLVDAKSAKGIARAFNKAYLDTLDLVQDKKLITNLATQHGLLTPYTAFIATEQYFGESANTTVAAPQMRPFGSAYITSYGTLMPQTSGNNDRLLMLGLILLTIGFLLAFWLQKNE